MKQINLLPKTEQKELKLLTFADRFVLFWTWTIISIVFFVSLIYTSKIYLQGQKTEIESQIVVEKQILKSSDNEILKQQVETINSQIGSIRNLQSQHYYWSDALKEIARLLPSDIAIDSVIADRGTGKIEIKGVAGNRASVLKFWADMHKTDYFKNIDFPLPNLNTATDDPFSFTFFIVPETLRNP